jgi:hypothetical protein
MRCFVVCFRCSPAHQRQSGSQRELGSGRQGRHGDDAEQDRTRGAALQALLRGPRRHAGPREGVLPGLVVDHTDNRGQTELRDVAGRLAVRTQGPRGLT